MLGGLEGIVIVWIVRHYAQFHAMEFFEYKEVWHEKRQTNWMVYCSLPSYVLGLCQKQRVT